VLRHFLRHPSSSLLFRLFGLGSYWGTVAQQRYGQQRPDGREHLVSKTDRGFVPTQKPSTRCSNVANSQ